MTTDVDRVRGRGRPRQFDEEQVLDTLLELFWDEGFEAASMADIAEATGLNKSSLYNTFGSKDELFYRVLERYIDVRQRILAETLGAEGTLEVLGLFLDLMRMEIDGESGARGCLAVNSSTELGPRDDRIAGLSDRYRGVLASAVRPPLERAAANGEIDAALVEVYVNTFVSLVVALSVAARSGMSREDLHRQIDSMGRLVDSWRC